jgi:hypothetical protein
VAKLSLLTFNGTPLNVAVGTKLPSRISVFTSAVGS